MSSKNTHLFGHSKRLYFRTFSRKECLFVFFNSIILVSTIIVAAIDIKYGTSGGQDGASVNGWDFFRPFTMDSNILMAIAATIALIKILRHNVIITQKDGALFAKPFGARFTNFFFLSVVSIDLTFVVVALFLAPLRLMHGQNGASMFMGDMFFFHLINPIAATCALFLLNGATINRTSEFLCYLPMATYSIIYIVHIFIVGDWEDFYNFTFGGNPLLSAVSVLMNILAVYCIIKILTRIYDDRKVANTNKYPCCSHEHRQPR